MSRIYTYNYIKGTERESLTVTCWDYGEPRDGDCEITEASSAFQKEVGIDPQDVLHHLEADGWKLESVDES